MATATKAKGKRGPKFTPTQRVEVDQRIAELDRAGFNQYEIARDVKLTQPMVSGRLKKIREGYNTSILAERRAYVIEKLALLADIRKRAIIACEKSGEDLRRVLREELESVSGKGGYTKRAETTEARTPAAEYMRIVLDTIKQEREMLGLDEAVKIDLQGEVSVNVFDWNALVGRAATGDDPVIAERTARALAPRVVETTEESK